MSHSGQYYLGIDAGGSKTHALLADDHGYAVGFAEGGPGNHQGVGYDGARRALQEVTDKVLAMAGIERSQIAGAGFGLAGFDWNSQLPAHQEVVDTLGLCCPYEIVNDAVVGLLAGAPEGWGVVLVAGTGNNCRGRDRRGREGRITGEGITFGEYGGSSELVFCGIQAISHTWSRRSPYTTLVEYFLALTGAKDLDDLIEGIDMHRYQPQPTWARTIVEAAQEGDTVARQLVGFAGGELGESACAVIRQLGIEGEAFDVVLAGSLFKSGDLLIDPLRATIFRVARRARLTRLAVPPVVGGVVLGMQQTGLETPARRVALLESIGKLTDQQPLNVDEDS
jgi:N-acetylglucosamine kinase-like BadF-type ATPase